MSMALADRDGNLKSVWDVMLINSARANKEDELQAVSLYNMAGWINDNEPLIDKELNKSYQIDRSTKTIARTGIVEALQKGWISENHPVFSSGEDFLQPKKILNGSAQRNTVYHKIRHHSESKGEEAVTAPHINGTTESEILNSAKSKGQELKDRIEEVKRRKISGEASKNYATFEQMMAGINAAVLPIQATMETLTAGIHDIKNNPVAAKIDATALSEIAKSICSNSDFAATVSLGLKPMLEATLTETKKAVTASTQAVGKITALEARILKLETDHNEGRTRIETLENSSTVSISRVDITSNEAVLQAHGDFRRGGHAYRADVEARARLGILRIALLTDDLTQVEMGVKQPQLNNIAHKLGSDIGLFSAVTANRNNFLTFLVKLKQATPTLTREKWDKILENRPKFKGELAVSATTPPQHQIDPTLFTWKQANVIFNYDTTKKGFYIIHLHDGQKNLIAVTAPAVPTREALNAYSNTCTRLNVSNPGQLAKLSTPKITGLRNLVRGTHFTMNGQILENPVWRNPRPTTFTPFISPHFTDGSDS